MDAIPIDWPFYDLFISESALRSVLPPCPRLIIIHEILNNYVVVQKSAQTVSEIFSRPVYKSIHGNGVTISWLSIRKQCQASLALKLKHPIAITKIKL